jgi:MerR family transcriptional regulator, heat shock protein HspR
MVITSRKDRLAAEICIGCLRFLIPLATLPGKITRQGGVVTASNDPSRGVYGISVAADLSGVGEQSLRAYEKRGLLEPERTQGGTRLYSDDDLARLARISELLASGLNLAGIAKVLELETDNARLRRELRQRHH